MRRRRLLGLLGLTSGAFVAGVSVTARDAAETTKDAPRFVHGAGIIAAQLADALGLEPSQTVRFSLDANVHDVVTVHAVMYPTQEQLAKMIELARKARGTFATSAEREMLALDIVRDVLGENEDV